MQPKQRKFGEMKYVYARERERDWSERAETGEKKNRKKKRDRGKIEIERD